ncbi:MAG: hypothetical protein IT441_07300, partial [Phycisphaeraceae bacterium]|nr:hypothetical protein [Phycisphaeraceae bacterium]
FFFLAFFLVAFFFVPFFLVAFFLAMAVPLEVASGALRHFTASVKSKSTEFLTDAPSLSAAPGTILER